MGKRDKLATVFCRRCNACHPEGEHLAKPKKVLTPAMMKVVAAELPRAIEQRVEMTPKARHKKIAGMARRKVREAVEAAAAEAFGEKLFTVGTAAAQFSANPKDLKHPMDQLVEDLEDGTLEHVLKGGVPGDKKYKELKAAAGGVALISAKHPGTSDDPNAVSELDGQEPNPDSLETIEIEVPPHPHPANADKPKKKRTKAEVQALVDAELARKRTLKNGRQQRWRDKQKKKPKKRGKK